MLIFKIGRNEIVICSAKKTRTGFRHMASLLRGDIAIAEHKVSYINRTWERYTYETVISGLLKKAGYKEEKIKKILDKLS